MWGWRGVQARAAIAFRCSGASEKLILDAISRYNSLLPEKRMNERDALLFVAALSENQQLQNDLENVERDGRRDGAKLT
jgi:hypothetical protein